MQLGKTEPTWQHNNKWGLNSEFGQDLHHKHLTFTELVLVCPGPFQAFWQVIVIVNSWASQVTILNSYPKSQHTQKSETSMIYLYGRKIQSRKLA